MWKEEEEKPTWSGRFLCTHQPIISQLASAELNDPGGRVGVRQSLILGCGLIA
jgi:hypothetical protein